MTGEPRSLQPAIRRNSPRHNRLTAFAYPGSRAASWLTRAGCLRPKRVVRPVVARIAALEVLPHFEVRRAPESREVTRHLYRPGCRRQQVDRQRDPAASDSRRFSQAEDLLQPHRQTRCLRRGVVHRDPRPARYDWMCVGASRSRSSRRFQPTTSSRSWCRSSCSTSVDPADIAELRTQPLLHRTGQRLVRKIRPGRVQLPEEAHPLPESGRRLAPPEADEPLTPEGVEQDLANPVRVGAG